MNGLIEDASGGTSTLRLSVLAAVGAGIGIIGCGLYGFLKEIKDSTIVIGAGQALIIAVLTLKVWQRSVEEKAVKTAEEKGA
jgi:hypothetical protein